MFIDEAKIYLKSGDGGDGAISFHREKYVPNGGPDGGDGGNGGSIIFKVSEGKKTLMDFHHKVHFTAENGTKGSSKNSRGKDGKNLIIEVPAGTLIKNIETGDIISDLYKAGDTRVLLPGGKGGKGNSRFATSTRQAPRFARNGEPGIELQVKLELALIADVGLIGFPNVGKSTILSMLTSARPKIADYHFTTLEPNLGVVQYGDKNFVLADIPGIIEGAAEGAGLGFKFLKHIQRTRVLLHVVDISGSEQRDPVQDFYMINNEMVKYDKKLIEKPQIIIANKMDIDGAEDNLKRLKEDLKDSPYKIYAVSAIKNDGLKAMIGEVLKLLDTIPEEKKFEETPLVLDKPEVFYNSYKITNEEDVYTVEGPAIDRLVNKINFSDNESFMYFQRMLKKMGVIDELRKNGIQQGNTVKIKNIEFDFVD